MKLKKLVLQGYKTFATKTEFIFDDGITAVVGPNGSGKSNVADAIRWVLGEQSFSTLRGKRTVDMIFAGSKSRARAGMAQAVLTLDNSDGWLPIDYTEVEIARRAYRSGENEYLLNGQKVRLMDINELLARAGIAEQTYTIIGQGLIDQALSLKADERRALFEEAAGISHYKSRRAASLRRLQDTQRNLERVYDILSELKPRLNSLRRQAERAENYGRVEEDLRQMLRIWYGYQWQKARRELRVRRTAAQQAEQGWRRGRATMLDLQGQIDRQREQLHAVEEQLQALQQRRETVREGWEKARRQVAILRERRRALERQIQESGDDLPELEQQVNLATAELQAALGELQTAQATFDSQQLELKAFESGFAQQQQLIDAARQEIQQLEMRQRQLTQAIAQAEGQVSQLKERLAGMTVQHRDHTALDASAEWEALEKKAAALREHEQKIAAQRAAAGEQQRQLERSMHDTRQRIVHAQREWSSSETTVARLQTRMEMLAAQRPADRDEQALRQLVLGRLVERLTIPYEHSGHLDHVLGALADTLIVNDGSALRALVDRRTAGSSWRAITLNRLNPFPAGALDKLLQRPGVIGTAAAIVQTEPADRPLVDALLGHILLVRNDQTVLDIAPDLPPGAITVSPSGLSSLFSGLITAPRQDGQESPLGREQRWRAAQAELAAAQNDHQAREKQLSDAQNDLQALEVELESGRAARQQLGRQAAQVEQQLRQVQREVDRVAQRRELLAQQRDRREQEKVDLEQRLHQIEQAMAENRAQLAQTEERLAVLRADLAQMPVGEARQQRQVLNQQISGARSIVDGRRAIVDSRQNALRQLEQQLARLKSRREGWNSQLLQMDLAADEQALERLDGELDELQQAVRPLQKQLHGSQKTLREREAEAAAAQKANHELETAYTQTRVALTQQETHIDNLQDRIRSELGIVDLSYDDEVRGDTPLPLTGVVDVLPQVDELPEELEESIQKQRGQLSRMGAINPDAPAEYLEVQERFDFMNQQVEDLEQTEIQLRQVIDELDELTSRAFADTVEKVNVVFGEMFTRLFGGGSGHLVLTDPDDLTVSGVDIVAQLPGRRPQGLALLSGGERSLTAASLIFALLKVSPTPFCAMDEVDAALDEANINRFREVLTELSAKTQFIVITHNRGTVQAAQAIYGITMGTDSASQVISIKPEEYVTQKELV